MITRNTAQRQFLLRPDEETNNAFAYCLADAARRCNIDVILPMAESNHHHTIVYDREGNLPVFMEHFHKMLARCLNARWGRWENLWAAEEACATCLLDRETIMTKLVYAATNPVKDQLVDQVHQWPGFNGYRHLVHRKAIRAHRPKHFFRSNGVMPDVVTLELRIPPELGDADAFIAELESRVRASEDVIREERLRSGKRVLGLRRIRQQSWRDSPNTDAPRRTLRPRFAGTSAERIGALFAYKLFLAAYDEARRAWKAGKRAVFPEGTYWLVRIAPVLVEPFH